MKIAGSLPELRRSCRSEPGFALPRVCSRVLMGMAKNILPKSRTLIPSSFVVRALAHQGPRFHCSNCGDVMFVRGATGLCPMCFNDRKPFEAGADSCEVPHDLVLAGVLDDPRIEGLARDSGAA